MVHKGQVNPSEAQRAYRSAGLDFWFPTKGGRQGRPARRRAVVEHFLNGDWLSTVVEHFCPENCCASEHEARESMLRLLCCQMRCCRIRQLAWRNTDGPSCV